MDEMTYGEEHECANCGNSECDCGEDELNCGYCDECQYDDLLSDDEITDDGWIISSTY